jgi:hypothetical protein
MPMLQIILLLTLTLVCTWFEEPTLQGKDPISAKWIFEAKIGSSGRVEKSKVRLVTCGFEQEARD